MHFIGLDAGSVSIKLVVLDEQGNKLSGQYVRHYGHPLTTALDLLREAKRLHSRSGLSLTGTSAKVLGAALKIKCLNEIVSQSWSVMKLFPRINTVIEMGGEDSKLIFQEDGRIRDFSMNSVCAAGTGSFLEQQAERLRLNIEEFSEMAVLSSRPSKIAGRCSVFAKSDMIHLQQIATPMEDIVAGLCFAVARNFKSAIAKGRDLKSPVAFQGGVAANKGMVRAFKEVFELEELFVPPDFVFMGALGAALKDMDEGNINDYDPDALEAFLRSASFDDQGHQPLFSSRCSSVTAAPADFGSSAPDGAYLGIDIGSISTNLALVDEHGKLLAKRYLMTAGRPIDAVRQGLGEIYAEVGEGVRVLGVGTTGSGRYMIADFVGADIVKNEITAQATAAIFIDPAVDTIFEIGGQDSKYISIRDGVIVDFEMNKACAAGTGSFLEEQAEKLGVTVRDEFAALAFRSKRPCRLGERCTVFMENSLMASLQRGAAKDDLLAGLAYSIVQNYINRVIAGKPVGRNIFFQGGVAFNSAVVGAFEKHLGVTITVPPNHDVTGAIGMALIAMRHMKGLGADERRTRFKGFSLSKRTYEIASFECKGCSNVCEINKIKIHGEDGQLFFGGRCERYDVRRSGKPSLPDAFELRQGLLWKSHEEYSSPPLNPPLAKGGHRGGGLSRKSTRRIKIGIPYIFHFHDYLPFWTAFLWELGFEVIVSPATNKEIIQLGVENVLSEACFPVKVAHGHIKYLVDAGTDAVFIPSFIDTGPGGADPLRGVACPHTQTIPYISKAAISGMRPVTPVVDLSRGMEHLGSELFTALKQFGIRRKDINRAINRAGTLQTAFSTSVDREGRELLAQHAAGTQPVVVIVGRAYNAFDPALNLGIPGKLSAIDTLSIPMDMLPLEEVRVDDAWPNMYWRSGQRILKAARFIANVPHLYAIYIGNFSCGPDSYILKYFKEEMAGKPFLHIEIDEHSADAGAITRCEAFLDSIQQQRGNNFDAGIFSSSPRPRVSASPRQGSSSLRGRTVYIPGMCDHTFAVQAAFERCGVRAEVLPASDKTTVDIGRKYVSGKECYPYVVTTGDMLKRVFSPDFNPGASAFFMPSGTGPCRFGQYNVSHKLVLEKLGLDDVPIFAPTQDVTFYRELSAAGSDFSMTAWRGIIAYELLTKCLHETRPYEREAGDAEHFYKEYREKIYRTLRANGKGNGNGKGKGSMELLLNAMRDDFRSVPRRKEKRPLIGVVGEIFVRSHKFSNEDLVRKIEALGGEVWLSPVEEWIYYVNSMAFRKALIKRRWSDIMSISLKSFFQKRTEHRYGRSFSGFLKTLGEPVTREILDNASPYVHDSFEGETVLSIGKVIDLVEKGAAGIINAMPFGCMPGTIVTALLKAVNKDCGVPSISIPYDGSESPATVLQLEAFMQTITTKTTL